MAERILRSPGVTTREIDLSAPGRIRPQGIPAGIIGTAQKGPAFVPTTFATATEFINMFGATGGVHFGAMAVNEWMRNARSGLFLRVLGVGDGKKSGTNGTNMTDKAGFYVGLDMRDKDNTAASQALSSGTYAEQETDGSAHGNVKNPYASSGQTGWTTIGAASGAKTVAGGKEISKVLILDNDPNTVSNYDGMFIIYHSTNADTASPTVGKNIVFLSAQAEGTAAAGERSVSGNKILDGHSTLYDFSSEAPDSLRIADISGATLNRNAIATAIAAVITSNPNNAVGSTIAENTGHAATPATLVITNDHFGNVPNISVGSTNTTKAVADYLSITTGPSSSTQNGGVSTAGIDVVDGVVFSQSIVFGDTLPVDDTLLTIKGEAGTSTIFGFASDGNATGTTALLTVNTTTDASVLDAIGGLLELLDADDALNGGSYPASYLASDRGPVLLSETTLKGASNLRFSWTASTKTVTITQNAVSLAALPLTATESEQNAAAPKGRTYFLGCDMFVESVEQDYLNIVKDTDGASTAAKILRGVLMFPSGVIPGVIENAEASSAITPASIAYGAYATNKDEGGTTGNLDSGVFKMVLNGFSNTANYSSHLTGSFDPLSPIYFAKVLNTDPTKIQERGHYLYAHYDVPAGLASHYTGAAADKMYLLPGAHDPNSGAFATTNNIYKPTYENWRQKYTHANTPWILSQTLGSPKKLFRFHMLDAGAGGHGQVKISIANIVKSTDLSSDYGRFDVQIRSASDLDTAPVILQSFAGVNLNPSSDRYIARVIGDQNTFYEFEKNAGKQKLVTEGLYRNNSQYVRVEVMAQVESGQMEATALPVGFQGKHHLVINGGALGATGLKEPPVPYRSSLHIGTGSKKVVDARFYWGTQFQDVRSITLRNKETGIVSLVNNLTKHYPSIGEYPAWVGDNRNAAQSTGSSDLDADAYNDNYFSLEKVWVRCLSGVTTNAVDPTMWHEAQYIRNADTLGRTVKGKTDGTSATAITTTSWFQSAEAGIILTTNNNKSGIQGYRYLDVAKDFGQAGSKKFFKFTVPVQGGFDGLDIFDQDKAEMNNLSAFREMSSNTSATLGGPDGPTTAAFRKGLDILAEKSDVDIQILATPGMRDAGITEYAVDKTEDRFDALYIMDMPSYDHDSNLVTTSSQETSVTNTAQKLLNRNLDTSFAATYFPDLVVQDGDNNVVVPPSVAVIGAMSLNDAVAHPWFAPAGFARGALASTLETAVKLNRPNMDVLYDSDINPITSFPEKGNSVVIFGQKTMLQAQSALDRVNVRRLLIDVRRKVRTVANTILFEPNREATLARFSSLVNPILGRIQAQQGVDRYKVVIDTTTTTQQDVENNTIRGKIFLQPTRSIEFISLDFVVTNAGAEI